MAERYYDVLALKEQSFQDDAKRITAFLEQQGTFRFPTLSTGLFSAAAGEGGDFELTGFCQGIPPTKP